MKTPVRAQLLDEYRAMRRTGLHPDNERTVGAALAARLPQIIASLTGRVTCGVTGRRVRP